MDQILALSRLSIFSTTKPKFDINGALTTRREQITILINKQIEDFEAIGFDDREVEKKVCFLILKNLKLSGYWRWVGILISDFFPSEFRKNF
ncbi:unnamed protein product [Meloidogyne enterolobii]|uniref:Uncharacterized protein n=1 Tax=Meloidogyne enterolobii TaxID=390850 RepID=A0ACB0Z6E2_MELEN